MNDYEFSRPEPPLDPPGEANSWTCIFCEGTGKLLSPRDCDACEGTGRVFVNEEDLREIRDQEKLDERRGK